MSVSVFGLAPIMGTVAALLRDALQRGVVSTREIEEACRSAIVEMLKRKGIEVPK